MVYLRSSVTNRGRPDGKSETSARTVMLMAEILVLKCLRASLSWGQNQVIKFQLKYFKLTDDRILVFQFKFKCRML